jgi:hyperosmotically inducible protein
MSLAKYAAPLLRPRGQSMKMKLAVTCLIIGASLAPVVGFSSDDSDSDRSHPKAFVKDSAITTKIKSKMAVAHLTSLARIHVDTDENGVVWLSGYASSQDEMDKAVSIAGGIEGVKAVKNHMKIKKDD